MNIFSERLKYERKLQGYTQKEFADKLGISQSTYKSYELIGEKNGREPSLEMILNISETLNVSIDYLFGKED